MSLESVFKLSLVMNMIDNLSGPMAGIASKVGANVSKLDGMGQTLGGIVKADFISAAYDIKSGISPLSDGGVAEFTGLAALTAKAQSDGSGDDFALCHGLWYLQELLRRPLRHPIRRGALHRYR